MLENGLTLMIVGMGTVFSFLIIMVLIMEVVACVIKHLNTVFPEAEEQVETGLAGKMDGTQEIAVAIAALKAYLKQ